jgi:hypothetical protein
MRFASTLKKKNERGRLLRLLLLLLRVLQTQHWHWLPLRNLSLLIDLVQLLFLEELMMMKRVVVVVKKKTMKMMTMLSNLPFSGSDKELWLPWQQKLKLLQGCMHFNIDLLTLMPPLQ